MTEVPIIPFTSEYADYLRDESRSTGWAESISFPPDEAGVAAVLRSVRAAGGAVTVQGARTGIAAGAVPAGGHILNLSRLSRVTGMREEDGRFYLTVQPGVILSELRTAITRRQFDTAGWSEASLSAYARFQSAGKQFFPPDPTETSCSLGGMAACNASGARTYAYGPTRDYIRALRVVLPAGEAVCLRRGEQRADGRFFILHQDGLPVAAGEIPGYSLPAVKNASGYYAAPDMDLIDLFIGSDGTLGVITAIEIELRPEPAVIWGLTAFFADEAAAVAFVQGLRAAPPSEGVTLAAIEYFNHLALDLLRQEGETNPAFAAIPAPPSEGHTAIYAEFHGESEDKVMDAAGQAAELIVECGGDAEAAWLAANEREMERQHAFRHAIPEAVNLTIDRRRQADARLTKLGTDMAVPDAILPEVLAMYNRDLTAAGLEWVMFGHIGNNHVHVNILPRSMDEYQAGKAIYATWARQVIAWGGTVSAEHGVGKMKVALLREMYGAEGIEAMRAVKQAIDPEWRLNRGNLFEME